MLSSLDPYLAHMSDLALFYFFKIMSSYWYGILYPIFAFEATGALLCSAPMPQNFMHSIKLEVDASDPAGQ